LVIIITTADDGKPGTIYDRKRRLIERLASGVIKDPTTFGVVWAAPAGADPFKEATWRLANPGLGISPTLDYMRTAAVKAQNSPADLAGFLRLHLGIRTKQDARYISLAEWDRNAGMVVEADLVGRVAYGGLDLGNVADLTALCWLFPQPGGGGYHLLWRFWLPEEQVAKLDKRTAGSMSQWVKQGLVQVTPGATTDYDFVIDQVRKDRAVFKVKEIGYDPWNANQLTKQLDDERAPLVEVRQGFRSMSPPLKECKRLLAAGTKEAPLLRHGGNPVMRWMTDNLAVSTDPAGNVKPDKAKAAEKIDGWAALVTGMNRAMHYRVRKSAYAAEEQ
jgi:phage terminase large subunit-like protein